MMIAASGCITLVEENLKKSLAASSTFRTWIGATGDDANDQARSRIHFDEWPPPSDGNAHTSAEMRALLPSAIVDTEDFTATESAVGEHDNSGFLRVKLEWDIPERILNDPGAIAREFKNIIGGIIDDLFAMSGTAERLSIRQIRMERPDRTHPTEECDLGDVFCTKLIIEHYGI